MSELNAPQLKALQIAHQQICDRIAAAASKSGRTADEITLVAVTKSATIEQIAGLLSLGQIDLGESRVQQLEQRVKAIAGLSSSAVHPPRWHMIGHLQRNKVKQVLPLVSLVHSVDSERLAAEIDRTSASMNVISDVLLQVNIAEEEQKYGLTVLAAPELARQIAAMPHVRLRGLMTMAPYDNEGEASRPVFAEAATLFEQLKKMLCSPAHFNQLSMGMSNDFEVAIEEGANVVRVGRALFEG